LDFIVGGLRELGEPSRKAMIVEFRSSNKGADGRLVLTWLRSLSIYSVVGDGGLLWSVRPKIPAFVAAGLLEVAGAADVCG